MIGGKLDCKTVKPYFCRSSYSKIDDTIDSNAAGAEELINMATDKEGAKNEDVVDEADKTAFKSPGKVRLKEGLIEKEKDASKVDLNATRVGENTVDASVIEASQKAESARSAAIFDIFENAKVLNRGYDHLPGLTVSCTAGSTAIKLNLLVILGQRGL